MPRVSVIIPTRNRRDQLRKCLAALRRQAHPDFEVVVTDDASDDGTPELLAEQAALPGPPTVRWVRHAQQRGANAARNLAIADSSGELIALLDDDATPEPGWLVALTAPLDDVRVGATTGLVLDVPPRSIWELAYLGTHRVTGRGTPRRISGSNACARRQVIVGALHEDVAPVSADTSVSGRCDEEGIVHALRASGLELRGVPEAVVIHDHPLDRAAFFRQALRGGASAARLGRKYGLALRPELGALALGWLLLPAGVLVRPLLLVSLACFALFLAAVAWNELALKGKTLAQALRSLPAVLAFQHVRAWGYFRELLVGSAARG